MLLLVVSGSSLGVGPNAFSKGDRSEQKLVVTNLWVSLPLAFSAGVIIVARGHFGIRHTTRDLVVPMDDG